MALLAGVWDEISTWDLNLRTVVQAQSLCAGRWELWWILRQRQLSPHGGWGWSFAWGSSVSGWSLQKTTPGATQEEGASCQVRTGSCSPNPFIANGCGNHATSLSLCGVYVCTQVCVYVHYVIGFRGFALGRPKSQDVRHTSSVSGSHGHTEPIKQGPVTLCRSLIFNMWLGHSSHHLILPSSNIFIKQLASLYWY